MEFQQELHTPSIPKEKRSKGMAYASLILGIASIVTSPCIYLSVVCGSLGIIFALLSKGGELSMDMLGKTGLILSSAGLILTLLIYLTALLFVLYYYGGIDGFMQEYMDLYNADTLEELYRNMGII